MPTGHYRFRRSLGNVGSRFRGARPDTYPLYTGVLDSYPGAAAAYSLRALSRGWLAGDVVEVRRDSDSTSQDFTASQITNGQMLSFVNGGTTSLYNSARYFNGTSTKVTLGTRVDFSTGGWSVSADVVIADLASGFTVFGDGIWWSMQVNNSGTIQARSTSGSIYSIVPDSPIPLGEEVTLGITRSGNTLTAYVDGVAQSSTATCAGSDEFGVDRIGNRSTFYAHGIIYNADINNQAAYTGLGTSVTAWEDTIGSNDGTETSGAAYTGQPFNGYVSTWYDQSGNANDATQIATASQPKIVDAGALVTGGLDFDGVDDYLEAVGFAFSPSGDFNAFTVANFSFNNYWDTRDGAGDGLFLQRGGSDFKSNYNGTSSNISAVTGDVLLSSELDGTDNNLYLNGGSKATTTVVAGLSTTANFLIGINFAGADGVGTMRELILYDTSQSANRAAIDAEIIANYGL